MRRIITYLLCLLLVFTLTSCKQKVDPREEEVVQLVVNDKFDEAITRAKELYKDDPQELQEMLNWIKSYKPTSSTSPTNFESFMKEKNVRLMGKDVQFDMKNNLDIEFAMEGSAELDNYYNYGFDDLEVDYFRSKI